MPHIEVRVSIPHRNSWTMALSKHDELLIAAHKGDAEAQFNIGVHCAHGQNGFEQDWAAARQWYSKAHLQGHELAKHNLGLIYMRGHGIPVNYAEALKFFKGAAGLGYPDSICNVGYFLRNGFACEKDLDQAFELFEKAANLKSISAQYNLADCYENGIGTQKDLDQAIHWYRRAAEHGHEKAAACLIRLLEAPADEAAKGKALENSQLTAAVPNKEPENRAAKDEEKFELPTTGDVLGGKYQIQGLIGKGGMSAVFKAIERTKNQPVAIKMLLPSMMDDQKTRARFEREARAANKVRHPNIVAMHDFGVSAKGQPYIVMDYVVGEDLEKLIKRHGRLSLPHFIHVFAQVCDALHAAHSVGIIHRDIKPSNIMLMNGDHNDSAVKLVDFGIAKIIESNSTNLTLTHTGDVLGSVLYMSPEQALGRKLDQRSDLYSLGCVMYEAITGKPAMMGETVYATIYKHVNDDPLPLTDMLPILRAPAELEELIFRCLEKKPSDRLSDPLELKRSLLSLKDWSKSA